MRNIESLTELAAENLDAIGWYADAESEIKVICKLENWSPEYFAGILSVTSPRCAVRRNIRITLEYVGNKIILSNVMQSIRRSIEIYENSGEIQGPKTSAFYRALTGDENAVVLDVHMANLFEVRQSIAFRRKGEIASWTDTVRRIAKRLDITARDCQAALWYAQKRAIGEYPENFPIAYEYKNWLAHGKSFPASGVIHEDFQPTEDVPF